MQLCVFTSITEGLESAHNVKQNARFSVFASNAGGAETVGADGG